MFWKFSKNRLNCFANWLCTHTHGVLPIFRQNGRHDVTIWPNCSKLKRTPGLWETISTQFCQNRPSSFAKRLWTDTQTHRQTHTHTQTPPGFRPDTITIHWVNEMTKCNKISFRVSFKTLVINMAFLMCPLHHYLVEYWNKNVMYDNGSNHTAYWCNKIINIS